MNTNGFIARAFEAIERMPESMRPAMRDMVRSMATSLGTVDSELIHKGPAEFQQMTFVDGGTVSKLPIEVELTSDQTVNNGIRSWSASRLRWQDNQYGKAFETFTVYDWQDRFPNATRGMRGTAAWDHNRQSYSLRDIMHFARTIYGILPSQLDPTDASKANCTITEANDGLDPGSPLTIHNREASSDYVFSGPSGGTFKAIWCDRANRYVFDWVEPFAGS